MKVAIAIHGNMRTFLMPLRKDPSVRVCDLLMRNLIAPNEADVFVLSDTNDFYHNGIQYYPENKRIELVNGDPFRLADKVDFLPHENAKKIVESSIKSMFGNYLKELVVEAPIDVSNDPKVLKLSNGKGSGGAPAMMVQQYRKIKMCHDMISAAEHNSFTYDIIIKARFDMELGAPLMARQYDFVNNDMYVPGVKGPVIFDWYAFGNRPAMHHYMTIYDNLGFTLDEGQQMFMCECARCGICIKYGEDASEQKSGRPRCSNCGQNDRLWHGDITIAPEYHVFRTLQKHKIRYRNAGLPVAIYRYKDSNSKSMDDTIKDLRIGNVTLVTHTTSKDVGEYEYRNENQ